MKKEIIDTLLSLQNFNHELGLFLKFSEQGYTPLKIEKIKFRNTKAIQSEKKIIFIDGGSSELFCAPNFCLSLIRIYSVIYKNNQRFKTNREEFFLLVHSSVEKNVMYSTKIFSDNPLIENLLFNSLDPLLRQGNQRAIISSVTHIIRRFCELKTAELLALQHSNSIILLDGNLQATYPKEHLVLESLYEKAIANNVVIAALAKTCNLLTDKGSSIISLLNSLAPQNWDCYYPIAEIENTNHQAEMFFVKLNLASKYIFRLDVFNKMKFDINEIITILKANSKDPLFPGYPYGLVEADKFAKIPFKEAESLKIELRARFGKDWSKIQDSLNTQNAHSVLDSING